MECVSCRTPLPEEALFWSGPSARSPLLNKLGLQVLVVPAVLLLTAANDFASRGQGSPMPTDPPLRLVTSGPYAYVANPMQLGKIAMVALWGLFWMHPLVVAAALLGVLYSVLVAAPREDRDMAQRFPEEWARYRQGVRRWWPRWRPFEGTGPVATLHLDTGCGPCGDVARWLRSQQPVGLCVASLASGDGSGQIAYAPSRGGSREQGVVALARALEHIHLGWAFFAWMLRLPGFSHLAQIIAAAFDPRETGRSKRVPAAAPFGHDRSARAR